MYSIVTYYHKETFQIDFGVKFDFLNKSMNQMYRGNNY